MTALPTPVDTDEVALATVGMYAAAAKEGRDVVDVIRSHRAIYAARMALSTGAAAASWRHQIDVLNAVEKQILTERNEP